MGDSQPPPPNLRIGYLGPQASFSHQAALEAFPDLDAAAFLSIPSFEAILSSVQQSADAKDADDTTDSPNLDFALLPVENSTNGGVVPVWDLFVRCGRHSKPEVFPDIEIVAEHYLQVHHCLCVHESVVKDRKQFQNPDGTSPAKPDFDSLNIKTLYSHPQVWGQCGKYLSAHLALPEVERIHMSSTSAAAVFVAGNPSISQSSQGIDTPPTTKPGIPRPQLTKTASTMSLPQQSKAGNKAAICSSLAGQQNNLVCIASNIEDEPGKNTTRFFIIRNRHRKRHLLHHHHAIPTLNIDTSTTNPEPESPSPSSSPPLQEISYKSLLTFTIPHTIPGSLATALSIFSKHNFNLTSITTRPSKEQPWHYVFFVECEKGRDIDGISNSDSVAGIDATVNDNADGVENTSPTTTTTTTTTTIPAIENKQDDKKVLAMFDELSRFTEHCTLLGSWVNRLRHE